MLERSEASKRTRKEILPFCQDDNNKHLSCWSGAKHLKRDVEILPSRQDDNDEG
ncbi:MAG: hypothetical protein IJB01_01160 [Bacteroidaceae bacterium]|nr:hypothetical protein [Bacteroidaceae bacterium]